MFPRRIRNVRLRGFAIALFACAMISPRAARAQTTTATAQAETLFNEGRRLADEGKYAEACPKFAAAQRVSPTPGTLLNLADCYEKQGKITSAWASFKDAAILSRAAGRNDFVATAQRRAQVLEPKLPRMVVTVASPAPGLEVKGDGVTIPREAWAAPLPVDPGDHTIEAHAPGRKTLRMTIKAPAEGGTVPVNVPELESESGTSAKTTEDDRKAVASDQMAPPPSGDRASSAREEHGWSTQKKIGVVMAGTGVVALGVGGVFAIVAMGHNSDSKAHCDRVDPNRCLKEGFESRTAAIQNGNIATGFGVAGLALAGVGTLLVLSAPSSPRTVALAPAPGGLSLWGRFE